MRRYLLVLIAITLGLAATAVWAPASPTPAIVNTPTELNAIVAQQTNCTKTGTNSRNIMAGTSRADVLCAKGGSDYLSGGAANDTLKGDKGHDTEVGNKGKDLLKGAKGPDRLFGVDNRAGDSLVGGAGNDQCFIDPGDKVSGCEQVFRGQNQQAASALSSSFQGQAVLAEALIAEPSPTPTPPPAPVPSPTNTFPACVTPPASPPPACTMTPSP